MKKKILITKNMPMDEVVKTNPRAKETLTYFHIGGCSSCAYDPKDTLETVANQYNIPVALLVKILNELH